MGYSLHIVRQSEDGSEVPITLDEWNGYIATDSDLKRPDPGSLNFSETLVWLLSDSADPNDWQWLSWVSGSIYSDYPQQPMLKKMGQIAKHFGAALICDDGNLWAIDEVGRISMLGMPGACSNDSSASSSYTETSISDRSPSQPPPLPVPTEESIPRPWFLLIQRSERVGNSESANQLFAEAISTSLRNYPVSIPIADLEEACSIGERLIELGYDAEVSGYDRSKS